MVSSRIHLEQNAISMTARFLTTATVLVSVASLSAQQLRVEGRVVDAQAQPIGSASVKLRGEKTQTLTNADGRFALECRRGQQLVISATGYKAQEVVVLDSVLTIRLEAQDSQSSSEGNISTTTRTATSIYGSAKPLWVLNGIILEDNINLNLEDLGGGDAKQRIASAISGLNADDIESFRVLKDASTLSIYGPRAIGGVIVVQTRKGSAGTNSISYVSELSYRFKPSYNDFNIMNSQDHLSVLLEMEKGGSLSFSSMASSKSRGIYGRMYELFSEVDDTGNPKLSNTLAARHAYLSAAERRNTDWFGLLYDDVVMHKHSVSLSSGSEKASYYASLSALFDPGWQRGNKINEYSGSLNASFAINKRLKLNLITNAVYYTGHSAGDYTQSWYSLNTSRAMDPREYYTRSYARFNILEELGNNYKDSKQADIKLQAQLQYKPWRQLELSALASIRYVNNHSEKNITEESNVAKAYRAMDNSVIRSNNSYLYTDPFVPGIEPISVLPEGGFREVSNNLYTNLHFRSTARWTDELGGGKHQYSLLAGMEATMTDKDVDWSRGYGMIYSLGEIPFFAYEAFKKLKEKNDDYYGITRTHYRNTSFFANASYQLLDKYTLHATGRYDATNSFAGSPYLRWIPTWNIGASWQVDRESFFPKSKLLSSLLLKVSYGMTGSEPYAKNSLERISANTPWRSTEGEKEFGLYISEIPNKDLTYEKNYDLNLGLSAGLLSSRVNLGLEWYSRRNRDLLGVVNTQGLSGQILKYGNVASMKSEGLDLSLQTQNIKTKDFSWTSTFAYSHSSSVITELFSNESAYTMAQGNGFGRKGYPIGALFSFPFMGLNAEGFPTFRNQDGVQTVGDIRFSEREKVDYLSYSGTTVPTDVGSLNNTLKYKRFTLGVFLTYSFGNVLRLSPYFNYIYDETQALGREMRSRWASKGDEQRTNIPRIPTAIDVRDRGNELYNSYLAYNYSDVRIAKGDFVRLKELSIAYDFGSKLLRPLGLKRLGVKLQAENLFLLYADRRLNGDDPEYRLRGNMVQKKVMFTLRVGL